MIIGLLEKHKRINCCINLFCDSLHISGMALFMSYVKLFISDRATDTECWVIQFGHVGTTLGFHSGMELFLSEH